MLLLVIVACVLASAFNAGSSLFEREAARKPKAVKLFSKQLSLEVGRSKKFLFGVLLQFVASAMEIVALSHGSLVLVGPLLTLDLVFLLAFISLRYKIKIKKKNWIAAILVVSGLCLLFICTQPANGHARYDGLPWIITIGSLMLVIAIAVALTHVLKSDRLKTGLLALATSFNYAVNAGLVKLVLDEFRNNGFFNIFLHWQLYTLIALGFLSLYLTQITFSSGSLIISQPIIEIVQALATTAIGIFIFRDVVKHTPLELVGDGICSLLLIAGIWILATDRQLHTPDPGG